MPEPITVLIVDDHSVVRMGVHAFLNTQPDMRVVGEATTGQQGVILAAQLKPDVVLMDLLLPGLDGVEATRQVKKNNPHTQVVVLTSYHDDEFIFPAIRAGALSYLLKDIDPDELADAIRQASIGEAVVSPRVATRLVKEINGARQETNNPFNMLTERELQVLQQIAAGKPNQEIAETLVISEKTVKSHVTSILAKLHLADRTQAAVCAWQEGIVRRNAGQER